MDTKISEQIDELVKHNKVFLFMKGDPTFPQCGFSNQVVQILKGFNIPFGHFDVLSDTEIRQGIKEYSDWPTIPQLFVDGEFVGGCDIVRESWQSGELQDMLAKAYPDRKIEGPKPPVQPKNITPAQAHEMMAKGGARFLDVRTAEEREISAIEGFELLDHELAEEMIKTWDRETPVVFLCHFGGRSSQACQFFSSHGFQCVFNVTGGIDAWSKTVDSGVARY